MDGILNLEHELTLNFWTVDFMYEIGDALLCGNKVGVVVGVSGSYIKCQCSDGSCSEFRQDSCTKISSYQELLEAFERSVIDACR